jgi:hypothetical protein
MLQYSDYFEKEDTTELPAIVLPNTYLKFELLTITQF